MLRPVMKLRLLVIAAQNEQRLLIQKHVEIEWPDAVIIEHRLGLDPPLDHEFAASGFDAVVVVGAAPAVAVENFCSELLQRSEFAPIVLILLQPDPVPAPLVVRGLRRLYGSKIDRMRLLNAITDAALERKKNILQLRARPEYLERYRFGTLLIRGHRCIKQIGSGGMSRVYLAESERAATLVVLKVFSQVPDVSERMVNFDRFLQEYEIVAGLKHDNIVRIYDLGVADDHAYIAMEYFPQGDLRTRMKTALSPATALQYVKQIASSLEAIHAVGVLHRDLKPANVMLRADGTVCLIDFGLAKGNELDVELTGTREIFGTPYYMSPEQGHAEAIDARSDLYSLGIMFYEMLIGHKPYVGSNAMEVIYKHKRAEVPEIAPQFAAFSPVLQRMMAKSPSDRFQSARELLEELDTVKVASCEVVPGLVV